MVHIKNLLSIFLLLPFFSIQTKEASSMNVKHVVIPCAGMGTRFLPYTKSIPKEMVALFNKPVLQYVVKEIRDSGINHICIIVNDDKPEIKHYFQVQPVLRASLKKKNKIDRLNDLPDIIDGATFSYPQQPEPLGLGHAVLMARPVIQDNFFGIALPDDLTFGDEPALAQLKRIAEKIQCECNWCTRSAKRSHFCLRRN